MLKNKVTDIIIKRLLADSRESVIVVEPTELDQELACWQIEEVNYSYNQLEFVVFDEETSGHGFHG